MAKRLDAFHFHEALDRAHVARDGFSRHVEDHPVVKADPVLRRAALQASTALETLYQLIGRAAARRRR